MYYYDKSADIFRLNQKYDENGKGMYVEYTDAAYKALFDDFMCFDEGVLMGRVCREVIGRLKKCG